MTATLNEQLTQQTENLTSLKAMLDKELHLISSRDAEALMTLLKDKEQLLGAIQNLDDAINPQLQALQQEAPLPEDIQAHIDQAKKPAQRMPVLYRSKPACR